MYSRGSLGLLDIPVSLNVFGNVMHILREGYNLKDFLPVTKLHKCANQVYGSTDLSPNLYPDLFSDILNII